MQPLRRDLQEVAPGPYLTLMASCTPRVAVVIPEAHSRGGTERSTAEVLARLAPHYEVHLFAHRGETDGVANVHFHRVPALRWPGLLRFLSFYAAATWKVRRAAREYGAFDCVFSPGPNCAEVEVCTAHFCQARQLDLLRSGKHRPPAASFMDCLKLAHRWSYAWCVSKVERLFFQRAGLRRVVAPSRLLARDLRSYYGVPEEKIMVSPSGVDCSAFTPEKRTLLREKARTELQIAPSEFAFFFLGNNWAIKGLYHVIRALAHVPDARVMVVGLGAERPESWQAFSQQCGVAGRITYLPRRPDILYYYAAADALPAPSVYDTFALMPLEAMACGLPVIISRNTGVAEIVGGEDCLIVENVEDTQELGAAMRRMAADPELCARLAANGRARARQHPWDRPYRTIADELEGKPVAPALARTA